MESTLGDPPPIFIPLSHLPSAMFSLEGQDTKCCIKSSNAFQKTDFRNTYASTPCPHIKQRFLDKNLKLHTERVVHGPSECLEVTLNMLANITVPRFFWFIITERKKKKKLTRVHVSIIWQIENVSAFHGKLWWDACYYEH